MAKALQDFLFGLCFGMGLAISVAVLHLVGELFSKAQIPGV